MKKIIILIAILIFPTYASTDERVGDLRLIRGDECSNGNHPTNVNLRFETIPLLTSLKLLAGFSCNKMRHKGVENIDITTNYTETPWQQVVSEICAQNKLKCWAENGVLYVVPNKQR